MINKQLIDPESIVVIGGSANLQKPGGKIIQNIHAGGYTGSLYAVNPKGMTIPGVTTYTDISRIPDSDLAILSIPAHMCKDAVEELSATKNTRAFIVLSAGFSEEGEEGKKLELELAKSAAKSGSALIGPNCIGLVTRRYCGVFTTPVPKVTRRGCDLVSGSGAVAVFIVESAIPKGLTFSSVFSVGNSAQNGIEEVLEYWDVNFDPEKSSLVKLIYIESIKDPDKLLHHASSLINKGCRIAAIKAGRTDAGMRAAISHTGALVSSDSAVEALFRKAGIVRCTGREELTTVASVFMHKPFKGKKILIITHAGGPAVMLADALSSGGLMIPELKPEDHNKLASMMYPGSSANNPVDLMATGTLEQLENVIDHADKDMEYIDGMIVIFGSNGMIDIRDIYDLLHRKINECKKPIIPILPSVTSTAEELQQFASKGHVCLSDEVLLGQALTEIYITPRPAPEKIFLDDIDIKEIRRIIDNAPAGFAEPDLIRELLVAAGIPVIPEGMANTRKKLLKLAQSIGYPLAMKVVGPVHKSDVGGVTLNIKSRNHLIAEFRRMMKIKEVTSVLVQPMLNGRELYIGAKYEPRFGHVILCGLGGIFVEVLGDFSSGLAPLTFDEARSMIRSLRSYRIIHGTRGQQGINEDAFTDVIVRLSTLLRYATEIKEADLNPLIGNTEGVYIVDARVRIGK